MEHKLDRRQYLSELIISYRNILSDDNSCFSSLFELITDEKRKCEKELDQIKQVDMEAQIMANASVLAFHTMT